MSNAAGLTVPADVFLAVCFVLWFDLCAATALDVEGADDDVPAVTNDGTGTDAGACEGRLMFVIVFLAVFLVLECSLGGTCAIDVEGTEDDATWVAGSAFSPG